MVAMKAVKAKAATGSVVELVDGGVVDHGDDGHREVDSHGVNVEEPDEGQQDQNVSRAESRNFADSFSLGKSVRR